MNAAELYPTLTTLLRAVICARVKLSLPAEPAEFDAYLADFEREPAETLARLAEDLRTLVARV